MNYPWGKTTNLWFWFSVVVCCQPSWQNCEKWLLVSSRLSVCSSICPSTWNNSAPTGQIFIKFDIWVFCENLCRKFKFHQTLTRIRGTSHEAQNILNHKSFISSQNEKYLRKKGLEKIKTRILCSITFFFENHAVYEIMCVNIVQPDRPQMTIWRTRIEWWISEATNTNSPNG